MNFLGRTYTPIILINILLLVGFYLIYLSDEIVYFDIYSILAITFSTFFLFFFNVRSPKLEVLSMRALKFIKIISLSSIIIEFIYFGIPILGGTPYNEFGFPVMHHFATMYWMVILFGVKKNHFFDFLISLAIAILLLNRQLMLFSILAYLISSGDNLYDIFKKMILPIFLVFIAGAIRNIILDIDASTAINNDTNDGYGLVLTASFFFITLYLIGPIYSAFGVESDYWLNGMSKFWNTVPEWARFAADGYVSIEFSYILFYGAIILTIQIFLLTKTKFFSNASIILIIYAYFTFFSSVILSTPIIFNYILLYFVTIIFPNTKNDSRFCKKHIEHK